MQRLVFRGCCLGQCNGATLNIQNRLHKPIDGNVVPVDRRP